MKFKILLSSKLAFSFTWLMADGLGSRPGLSADESGWVIVNTDTMKITIMIEGKTATAVLQDSPASREFAATLPLDMQLEDYNKTEKIANLPRRLNTQSAPAGYDPSAGDISYYAPWGNLAIFYKDYSYSTGLVSLGKITKGMEAFEPGSSMKVRIELEQ